MIPKRKNLKKDKFSNSAIFPIVLIVLFLAISAFLVISNFRIYKRRAELNSQIQNLQGQIRTLEEKKSQLEAGISQGQSETFLEEQAREKLGLKKPGEEVVTVLPAEQTNQEKPQENKSLWQKILEKLGF